MNKIARGDVDYMVLLYSIFRGKPEGEELLKIWEQRTFYEPGIHKDELDREIFIREGEKRFVRDLMNNLNNWEKLAPIIQQEDIIEPELN